MTSVPMSGRLCVCASLVAAAAALLLSTSPAGADRPQAKVTHLSQLLDRLPADAKPDQAGWGYPRLTKAGQWLLQNMKPTPVRLLVPVFTAGAHHAPSPEHPGRDWRVNVRFEPELYKFEGVTMGSGIAVPPNVAEGEISVWVTKDVADRVDDIGRGDFVAIEGLATRPKLVGDGQRSATFQVFIMMPKVDLFPTDKPAKPDARPAAPAAQPAEPAPDPEAPDAAPASAAEAEANARPFTTIRQMFDGLPADAAPAPNKGWDKFTFPKAKQWLTERTVGKPVRLTGKIASISGKLDARATDPAQAWVVTIRIQPDAFNFRGVALTTRIEAPTIYGFMIRGDEAFAKRMERIPKGRVVAIEGVVDRLKTMTFQGDKLDFTVHVKDYAFPTLK